MSTPAKRAEFARDVNVDAGRKASTEEDISKVRMHDRANFIVARFLVLLWTIRCSCESLCHIIIGRTSP